MLRKILFILFTLFAGYYVFLFETIPVPSVMIFKLIPMLLLILLALLSDSSRYKWLMVIGLLFCAVGDYTIQWFIFGLISFLTGHLFYISAFFSLRFAKAPTSVKVLLLLYGTGMAFWLVSTLLSKNDFLLAVAVCAYIAIILTMGWTSFRTNEPFAIIGALLFISSDSILAINRFVTAIPFEHELIMLTYYTAQLFLVLSIRKIQQKMIQ